MRDLCLSCGCKHEHEIWGANCNCQKPDVVHRMKCDLCDNVIGFLVDDDYHTPERLCCSECLDSAMINVSS